MKPIRFQADSIQPIYSANQVRSVDYVDSNCEGLGCTIGQLGIRLFRTLGAKFSISLRGFQFAAGDSTISTSDVRYRTFRDFHTIPR